MGAVEGWKDERSGRLSDEGARCDCASGEVVPEREVLTRDDGRSCQTEQGNLGSKGEYMATTIVSERIVQAPIQIVIIQDC